MMTDYERSSLSEHAWYHEEACKADDEAEARALLRVAEDALGDAYGWPVVVVGDPKPEEVGVHG